MQIASTPSAIALCNALTEGNLIPVRMLLRQGADVHGKDLNGWRPIHVAAYHGYASVVTDLVTMGADVNAANERGETALHLAARRGHGEAAAALLRAGASPRRRSHSRETPIHEAARLGHAGLAMYLRSYPVVRAANFVARCMRMMAFTSTGSERVRPASAA